MKKIFFATIVAAAMLASCGSKATQNNKTKEDTHQHQEGDGHNHDEHNHEGHNHDEHEGDNHEGHDHEGHSHDEDGHDHDAHSENTETPSSAGSVNGITFTQKQAQAIGLKTVTIQPKAFNHVIKTGGQIVSAQGDEVTLVATASGVVSFGKSGIIEGNAVKAGGSVASISSRNIVDGDPVMKNKAAFDAAQKAYKRAESLAKDKLISQKEFDQARLEYETARITYNATGGSYNGRGVSVASPISGFIKNRMVNEGEYVTTGQPIATVSQNKKLQLRADVSEKYYRNLAGINSANFKTPYNKTVYKLSDLKGRLLSYGKAANASSFYLPVTFEFDNVGQMIPGSFVEVYLLAEPVPNALSVPISALVEEQGINYVFIQKDKENYTKQEVTLGDDNGQEVRILSGIKAGDKIVSQGAIQVKLAANASVIPEGHSH